MHINYETTNWKSIPKMECKGTTDISYLKTLQYERLHARIVEYSTDYEANYGCEKGHIVYCLKGDLKITKQIE